MPLDVDGLYRKYAPMVLRRCRALMGGEDAALDAMQDTFVKVLSRKDILEDKFPSSLLYRIATNVCLNLIRSSTRKKETPAEILLFEIASAQDIEEEVFVKDLLGRIFSNHPESTRVMAVMHFADGMTLEETAEACRMSVSGVRKRLRSIREKLQPGALNE